MQCCPCFYMNNTHTIVTSLLSSFRYTLLEFIPTSRCTDVTLLSVFSFILISCVVATWATTNNTTETLDRVLAKPHRIKNGVFVSFRGRDIRHRFMSQLVREFSRKKVSMFVDSEMEKGKDIREELTGAIESSRISVVIFSANYTNSLWCLEELLKILQCKETLRQDVLPVFYNVDRSHVHHQRGTVASALLELETKYGQARMHPRRSALKDAASIVAFDSINFRNDAELLEAIINYISFKFNGKHPINSKGYIGTEEPIAHIKSLLLLGSDNVRVIGVWGMGGIGKTTIAEEAFYRLCHEFNGCAFLANVRQESQRHGIISLKEKLFSTLLHENLKIDPTDGLPSYVKMRLVKINVLIVLDDVNDSDQLETLVGDRDWFGSGSRIIVTSRDKQVLANEVDHIHEVGVLDFDNSLKLFNMNAFKGNHHLEMEYDELSKRVIDYAKGNPLVLEVLGHLLRGKDKELWESQLYKLKKYPIKKIYDVMKLSYDDLDNKEQKVFLDIACFFNGLILDAGYMKILLKDHEGDNSMAVGLERLKDKSLINVSEHNLVYMHDIIQGMGREIVRQECSENPGRRSRLWDPDDISEVFKNNKGTESIRSIRTNLSEVTKLKLSPHVFFKMSKLQFIDFHSENEQDGLDILPEGLEYLPTGLRYLRWMNYPLKSLPKGFSPENLVILDLSYSQQEILWHGVQNLMNLKQVRLYGSKFLKELPDFSKAINLELLDVRFCPQLTKVNASILNLNKLEILD